MNYSGVAMRQGFSEFPQMSGGRTLVSIWEARHHCARYHQTQVPGLLMRQQRRLCGTGQASAGIPRRCDDYHQKSHHQNVYFIRDHAAGS